MLPIVMLEPQHLFIHKKNLGVYTFFFGSEFPQEWQCHHAVVPRVNSGQLAVQQMTRDT